jgi:hypothetical protein
LLTFSFGVGAVLRASHLEAGALSRVTPPTKEFSFEEKQTGDRWIDRQIDRQESN